jgi:hypothetical protein
MKAFISYSHRNERMLERFHTHLAQLRRESRISDWYDRQIVAGAHIDHEIFAQLEDSQVFIPLVSADFLSSNYCYEKEMSRAIERHAAGEVMIVPVILEPCDWRASPLGTFKALPKDGRPISEWPNEDAAWFDVVTELRRLAQSKSVAGPRAAAAPVRSVPAAAKTMPSKYRVKRSFDQIDRDDFRVEAFEVVRDFFERSVVEIHGVDGVRARYQSMGPNAFTCTVINRLIKTPRGGEAHITVHASPQAVLGEIYYSFEAHASSNTANGGFSIEADDYHLFLRPDGFSDDRRDRTWSAQEIAGRLWQEFLAKAGITYG